MAELSSHDVKKKIFIHEDNCQRQDGELYTVTTITYMAEGLKNTITLFSNKTGLPEFIKTNERIVSERLFDEENTDDKTG
jgi:hypothetical protein